MSNKKLYREVSVKVGNHPIKPKRPIQLKPYSESGNEYDEDYEQSYNEDIGYDDGYEQSYNEDLGYDEDYEQSYNEDIGYDDGYEQSYNEDLGYDEDYEQSYNEDIGYDTDVGYDEDYEQSYNEDIGYDGDYEQSYNEDLGYDEDYEQSYSEDIGYDGDYEQSYNEDIGYDGDYEQSYNEDIGYDGDYEQSYNEDIGYKEDIGYDAEYEQEYNEDVRYDEDYEHSYNEGLKNDDISGRLPALDGITMEDLNTLKRGEVLSAKDGLVYDVKKSSNGVISILIILILLVAVGILSVLLFLGKGDSTVEEKSFITQKIESLLGKRANDVSSLDKEPLKLTEDDLKNQINMSETLNKYVVNKYPSVDNVTVSNDKDAVVTFKAVDYPLSEDTTYNAIMDDILNIFWDIKSSGIEGVTFNSTANFEDKSGDVKEEQLIDVRFTKDGMNKIENTDEFIALSKVDNKEFFDKSSNYKINEGIFNKLSNRAKGTMTVNEKE